MDFYSPWMFLLFLLLPVVVFLQLRKRRTASVKFSSVVNMKKCPVSWRLRLRFIPVLLRVLCLVFLIVALARPRRGTVLSSVSTEGVAMEVVVDRSGSMQAEMDYKGETMNRLEAVKRVLKDFIGGDDEGLEGRGGDLIGLVSVARYADTICPLVHSHNVLLEFLKNTEIVTLRSENSTAIGDAIALAAARLKKAEEEIAQRNAKLRAEESAGKKSTEDVFEIKSKVIILLTDGRNETGKYNPLEAAKLANEWGIKIYTIGIGSAQSFTTVQTLMGSFKMPTRDNLDERLLRAIAENTGGFYARGGSGKELLEIYKRIDEMEKTKVKSVQYTQYAEQFGPWAFWGLWMLGVEMIAQCSFFRKIP